MKMHSLDGEHDGIHGRFFFWSHEVPLGAPFLETRTNYCYYEFYTNIVKI
jgi:hypothetical protein